MGLHLCETLRAHWAGFHRELSTRSTNLRPVPYSSRHKEKRVRSALKSASGALLIDAVARRET